MPLAVAKPCGSACAGDCSWCAALPPRLRDLHSHWLLRSERAVLLRGVRFDEREVSFVILDRVPSYTAPQGGSGTLVVEVPSALRKRSAVRVSKKVTSMLHDCCADADECP